MRALIVDDDFYSRSFLEYILHPYARCDAAVNGEDAVMAFKKALEAGEPYTLVFMDLLMPVIDGPRALKEARGRKVHPGRADASRLHRPGR